MNLSQINFFKFTCNLLQIIDLNGQFFVFLFIFARILNVSPQNGREVRTSFTIGVNKDVSNQRNLIAPLKETDTKPKANKPQASIKHNLGVGPGKPSLTEQVHSVGKLSRLQESRALLDSLKQL